MSEPGYVIIPIVDPSDATTHLADPATTSGAAPIAPGPNRPKRGDRWRFGRSADGGHLSPVAVARTMHGLVTRVSKASTGTDNEFGVMPFTMSPITGQANTSIKSCTAVAFLIAKGILFFVH